MTPLIRTLQSIVIRENRAPITTFLEPSSFVSLSLEDTSW